jgi:UDP-N-acetylglucosamine acyltransferase
MAYVHIAHDCQVGNHTIFANNATLAGHVSVQDYAILGGFSTACTSSAGSARHVILGMVTVGRQDVPPLSDRHR